MSDLRDLTRALKDISGAAKAAGKAGQALGKAAGDITGADDQYRRTDADHEERANRAEIRRNKSAAALRGSHDDDEGRDTAERGGRGAHGARGARGERAAEASSSDTLVGAVAEVMRMAPNSPERADAIRNITAYIEANPKLHKQTYNNASGSRNHTYELPQIGDAPQHANDISQPKVRPIKGAASAQQLIEAISKKLEPQVDAPAISRSELGLPPDRAAKPAQAPASPAADEEKTPKYFVAQAAHALANGAAVKDIPLDGLKKKDGLYHLPAGSYSTGRSDARGNQITLEIPKEGLTLSLEEMQKAMAAKLAVVGVGQPQKTAATAEPAPAEPAKPIHVVHKDDAPKPDVKTVPEVAMTKAAGGPAKLYQGTAGKVWNTDDAPKIAANQVKEIQAMLGVKDDTKWGPVTQEAFAKKCKEAGVSPKEVDFTNPRDPELLRVMAVLNKDSIKQVPDVSAPAAAPVQDASVRTPQQIEAAVAKQSVEVAQPAGPATTTLAAALATSLQQQHEQTGAPVTVAPIAEPAPAPAVAAAPAAQESAPAPVAAAPAAPEPQPAIVAVTSPAFAAMPAVAAAGRDSLFGAASFGATEAQALPTPDAIQVAVAQARSAVVNLAAANEATFAPSNVPNLKAGGGHSVA